MSNNEHDATAAAVAAVADGPETAPAEQRPELDTVGVAKSSPDLAQPYRCLLYTSDAADE